MKFNHFSQFPVYLNTTDQRSWLVQQQKMFCTTTDGTIFFYLMKYVNPKNCGKCPDLGVALEAGPFRGGWRFHGGRCLPPRGPPEASPEDRPLHPQRRLPSQTVCRGRVRISGHHLRSSAGPSRTAHPGMRDKLVRGFDREKFGERGGNLFNL